jgi:DNA polymerase-3 subunit epsilon
MNHASKDRLPLELTRPLAVFDIESTGTSPRSDRIVELTIVKIFPEGRRETHSFRVNPGIPIPEDVTAIHGITDADVKDCPAFAEVAGRIRDILEDCDLCGYNMVRFDLPMLAEELGRAGVAFETGGRRLIDAQRIFHRKEPRDLSAALAFYCGELHLGAHGAEADVLATIRVLEGQFARYRDIPRSLDALHDYCNPKRPGWVDQEGRLKWEGEEIVLNFGRKKGAPLRMLIRDEPDFVKWILRSDFPPDTRKIVADASQGIWPRRPRLPEADAGETDV